MSQRLLNRPFCILMAAAALLLACEGPVGPEGPLGPPGEQGEKGDKGDPGSANVFYSSWISFQIEAWNEVTVFGQITQQLEVDEALVTQEILDEGVVLVYVRFGGAPAPRLLPFVGYLTSSKPQMLWFNLAVGTIRIIFQNLNDNMNPGTFGSNSQYRYVIIPGGTPVGAGATFDLTTMTYEEVLYRFDIPADGGGTVRE